MKNKCVPFFLDRCGLIKKIFSQCRLGAVVIMTTPLLGCPVLDHLIDELAENRCEVNACERVNSDRRALLCIQNFVYVDPSTPEDAVREYASIMGDLITRVVNDLNGVYAQNDANLFFLDQPLVILPSENLDVLNMATVWGPDREDEEELSRNSGEHSSSCVPVHWFRHINSENDFAVGGVSAQGWEYVLMHGYGPGLEGSAGHAALVASHELGHYFGLPHARNRPGNLLNDWDTGVQLDQDQVGDIWSVLNTDRLNLWVMTCDAVANRVKPQHRVTEKLTFECRGFGNTPYE